MRNIRSKWLAMLLMFMMIITMIPASAFAEGTEEDVPFTATVGEQKMTNISESILTWTDWSGSASNVTCYTVTIPAEATEVTLAFDEEKQWSYYDSKGEYVGDGDTSYMASTEHTVAVTDSNNDGELDGISVQIPEEYTTEYYILFAYAGAHTHTYDAGVTDPAATCNEPGMKTFTCTGCDEGTEGHIKTEEIPATGHSYNEGVVSQDSTCAATGIRIKTCTNNGCTEETEGHTKEETISKKEHEYGDAVLAPAPTCTEAGINTYTCKNCPEGVEGHTKTAAVDKLGHNYNENRTCTRCGDVAPEQDENGVYQLRTAAELLWFAETVNTGYDNAVKGMLIADIELDDEWPGIGISGKAFAGSFDGNNKTITLNGSTFGVFGYVKGTSSNRVQITNVITEGTVKNTAIVHSAEYVTVENCINRADVGGDGKNSGIAGIIGTTPMFKSDCVIITDCSNEGDITGIGSVAGILANSENSNVTITGCSNSGAITGMNIVGGIAGCVKGYPNATVIKNCYNTGKISGNTKTGGLVGYKYNDVNIVNCYNAGEATYAIAGYFYNSTGAITDTYYRGDLCTYSVPDDTQAAGTYTGNRGIAKTSAEMSSADFATLLGEAFKQSCPSPVLQRETSNSHTMESGVCQICKTGNDMPTEYAVTFVPAEGSEIVGDTAFRAGSQQYTFKVNVLDGYYKTDSFGVYVNGSSVEAVDGVYTVENPDGPFYITVKGVAAYEGVLSITLPKKGNGYRVKSYDGYDTTVNSGSDYKFTVEFIEGFEKGDDFAVKATDGNGNTTKLTADGNGVYTIENILLKQSITVEGVDAIPGQKSVEIRLDITRGYDEFLESEETDVIMMNQSMEIPYFDLELYDYEKYYYNPYCYLDENGSIKGQQQVGTRETAYNVVTSMHAFIYMTEVYYLGYDEKDAGTGLSDDTDSDHDGLSDFDEAVSWTQNVGSSFMDLWGLGTNLNYHLNYRYPIAYPKWGSTSDQQALKDGDLLSVHMITGSASGSAFGLFVANDTNNTYEDVDQRDSATVTQGEEIKLTHYLATQGPEYTTAFVTAPNKNLYWIEEDSVKADMTTWNRSGKFGGMDASAFKTDANGEIVIDTTEIQPGTYYIGAAGGFQKGSGEAGSDGFVSNGAEAGPAYFKLTVEESTTAIHQDELGEDYLKDKPELQAAGYTTVEKIEEDLFKEMSTLVEHEVSKDNTAILEIMLVYADTGKPVTKEDFPEEGLDIYIDYDKIFAGKGDVDYSKYDYSIVHMFSMDMNGHEAGELEDLKGEVTDKGLKVHVKGLSPFAISYAEKVNDPVTPEDPVDPTPPTGPDDPTTPETPGTTTPPEDTVDGGDGEEQKSDDTRKPDDNDTSEESEASTDTGDDSNLLISFMIMLIAGMAAFGLRKKKS